MKYYVLIGMSLVMSACDDPFAADATRLYKSVATGGQHTCAVAMDGSAYCWGRGLDGELGIGVKENRFTPARVSGNLVFEQITAGETHSCAITTDGTAYCWGWNPFYQRGNPTDPRDSEPVPVTTSVKFRAISAGAHHTCALSLDSLAYCWGFNRYGQLGDATTDVGFEPVRVAGGNKFTQITAGAWHSCGVTAAAAAFCWGRNEFGQLGIGSSALLSSVPVAVTSTLPFQQIDGGVSHTCALSNRTAYCWGSNEYGELGNGAAFKPGLPAANVPVATSALLPVVVQISAGASHTCATNERGQSWCWGRAVFGQLGNGDTSDHYHPQPLLVQPTSRSATDLFRVAEFAAGGTTHACALADDAVFCWGTGSFGELGLGEITLALQPRRVSD